MTTIGNRLQDIQRRIAALRPAQDIKVLAVSKAHPAAAVRAAYAAGLRCFGENYVQEALPKLAQLADLDIEWHFIGPIQSNKTTAIAQHFQWVQSLDRDKIAQRLDSARAATDGALNVCLQVNPGGESSKQGVPPAALAELAGFVAKLPRLRLRGLMCIPEPDGELARLRFAQMKQLFDQLKRQGFELDTLSMGMSDDFELAIASGATLVRLGTVLFGARS